MRYFIFVLLCLIWGTNFLLMKIAGNVNRLHDKWQALYLAAGGSS